MPSGIVDTRQLYWHKIVKKKKARYFPCRVCPKEMIIGLRLDQNFDESKKSAIEYLSYAQGGEHSVVSKKSLVPLENESWNANCMKVYLAYLNKSCRNSKPTTSFDIYKEKFYLEKILRVAKKRKERKKEEEEKQRAGKTQETSFDEPEFWNDLSTKENKNLVASNLPTVSRNKDKLELKAGDWIEYTKPIFVAGDSRGKTHAIVVEVNPKKKKVLELHPNNEILPETHMIKRLGTRCKSSKGMVQYRPMQSACFQEIREYRLVKSKLSAQDPVFQSILSAGDNLSETIQRHMHTFKEQVKLDGLHEFLNLVNPIVEKEEGREAEEVECNKKDTRNFSRKRKNSQRNNILKGRRKSLRLAKQDSLII